MVGVPSLWLWLDPRCSGGLAWVGGPPALRGGCWLGAASLALRRPGGACDRAVRAAVEDGGQQGDMVAKPLRPGRGGS